MLDPRYANHIKECVSSSQAYVTSPSGFVDP